MLFRIRDTSPDRQPKIQSSQVREILQRIVGQTNNDCRCQIFISTNSPPATFACWKIRFKTEVCTCSQFPTEAMHWIKEVEMVDSVDDLKSSCSVRGIRIPYFEVLDAKIASALNKIIQNTRFKNKVTMTACTYVRGIIVRQHHTDQKTNGIAERAVRRVKEGTSAVLLQSGLDENWWVDSMECYTYLRNVQDLLSGGKTPYETPFGEPFKGPVISFGSLIEYYPISAKNQSRIHQFGKKVLCGLFLGYTLYAGGIWKCDVLVADIEELETMDASEIYSKRLNFKEVTFPKENGNYIFPIADGRIKLLGGDQDLRTSTSIRDRPIRGEGQRDILGESEGSPHHHLKTHFW